MVANFSPSELGTNSLLMNNPVGCVYLRPFGAVSSTWTFDMAAMVLERALLFVLFVRNVARNAWSWRGRPNRGLKVRQVRENDRFSRQRSAVLNMNEEKHTEVWRQTWPMQQHRLHLTGRFSLFYEELRIGNSGQASRIWLLRTVSAGCPAFMEPRNGKTSFLVAFRKEHGHYLSKYPTYAGKKDAQVRSYMKRMLLMHVHSPKKSVKLMGSELNWANN
jgi:hypothetical protein